MEKGDYIKQLNYEYLKTIELLFKGNVKDRYLRFYHLNTVRNIISHIEKLNEDAVVEVYFDLLAYFKIISKIEVGKILEVTEELFYQYVEPIINKHYLKLGFSVYSNWRVFFFVYSIFSIILLLFPFSIFIKLLIILIVILIRIRILIKKNKGMVFNYKY